MGFVMLQQFVLVGGNVLTLFLLMSVGFAFGRKGLLSDVTLSQMSRILLYVVTPAVIITSFEVERTPARQSQLLIGAAVMVCMYLLYALLSLVLFRREDPDRRGILSFASVYGNIGFMGLPLIQSVMGSEAMMIAVLGVAGFNLAAWTQGITLIGGRSQLSLKKALLSPGVTGLTVGVLLFFTGWRLPGPVDSAARYLGSLNTPLAMIVIGGQMAQANLPTVFRDKALYLVSAVKLLALPALTAAVLLPFRLDWTVFVATVILAGCPTAGNTSLFAQSMGKDTALAARQITLSTLLCILTLPLTAALAQMPALK